MLSKVFTTAVLAASLVSAQTSTACDPTKKDCPADPALGGSITVDFRKGANDFFNVAAGTTLSYDGTNGAVFTINKETDAPTVTSTKYIFFGKVDVTVRAAPGAGIVTSFVLQSDDLDEIDWEWVGGDTSHAQTNYFSRGCTDVYDRGGMSAASGVTDNFITYSVEWTPTQLTWSINGAVVRTLTAASASGCDAFPQTPMQIKLGTWVGGSSTASPGTVQWAGGLADFSKAPFKGYYQSITVTDYQGGSSPATGATSYEYADKSGFASGIKVVKGGSTSSSSSSSASSSGSQTSSASTTSSGSSKTTTSATTLTTATTAGSFTNGTTTTGSSGSGTTAATITSATSTATTAPKNAAGKASFSLAALAGAALVAAFAL